MIDFSVHFSIDSNNCIRSAARMRFRALDEFVVVDVMLLLPCVGHAQSW